MTDGISKPVRMLLFIKHIILHISLDTQKPLDYDYNCFIKEFMAET